MSLDVYEDQLIGNGRGSPDHKKQRRESLFGFEDDNWCGVVFGCEDSRVMVGVVDLNAGKHTICSVAAPKDKKFDFSRHWAFAIVESKLFATGGQPTLEREPDYPKPGTWVYPRQVYFCDLQNAFTNSSDHHLEFELAATLHSPKISPLVVPYKNKIFFIANPSVRPTCTDVPCEVLLLDAVYSVRPLQTPHSLEQSYGLDGHLVVGNKLYVRAWTATKQGPSLYCLDMDTEAWEAGGIEDSCVVPEMLKDVCQDVPRRPLNYVHGDKLFKWELDVDPSVPSFSVVNLKDKVEIVLRGVVQSMGLEGLCVMDGWVLPCDHSDDDMFCVMIWIQDFRRDKDSIMVCKFRLADGGFTSLTKTVTLGPFPPSRGIFFVGFTAAINKVLRVGDYTSKFEEAEFETMDGENMKDFAEFCQREDDAKRKEPGYVVDPDENKPYYLTRPEVDLSHLWIHTEITDYIDSSDDDGAQCAGDGDGQES
ncbi:hypothetical protein LINGRAHAP2_LOCUS15991 [Linum grandiflorum]